MGQLTVSDILLRLLAVLVLIAINAFFVTAEFSIIYVRRSRIQQLSASGDPPAQAVQNLQQHIDRLLSTTQLGITLSSLALGWIGQAAIATPLSSALSQWEAVPFPETFAHSLSVLLAFCLIAYLQLVLGELCPKSVALIYAEQLSRILAPPSVVIARFFKPFIWGLNLSTRWLLSNLGVQYDSADAYNRLTPEELQLIISTSTESSGLRADQREQLTNLFEFGDATAAEVMIPRTQMVALNTTDTVQRFLEELSISSHSRYPVVGDSLDDIQGIIDFKDIAEYLARSPLNVHYAIAPWIAPPNFIPDTMVLSNVLDVMKTTKQAMLIVVDEFGGTSGLITFQDLMGEILGDRLHDSDPTEDTGWQKLSDGSFIIQAQMPVDEVNTILSSDFPVTDDYHTLAGFMIHHLQTIPEEGETWCYNPWELVVIEAEDNRIHKIRVRLLSSPPPSTLNALRDLSEPMDQPQVSDQTSSEIELNTP